MAALEDSPSRCQGQSWTLWAQRVGFNLNNDENDDVGESSSKREGDAMKLRKEDMALFGFCPAQDEFYLVVCEMCGQVVKPQALKTHIEVRHSSNSITRLAGSSSGSSSSSSTQHSHNLTKTSGKDLHHHSHQHNTFSSGERLGQANKPSSCSPKHNVGHLHQSKGGGHYNKSECKTSALAGSKKNHSLSSPVVRVERISNSLMIKKAISTMGPPGSAVSPAAIPVDKRELPSPQQPPPQPMFHPSTPSPSLSMPSPAAPLQHCQQQHHPVFVPSSGTLVTGTSLNQGMSSTTLTSSLQSLHKKATINATFAALSNSSVSLSSENKPKPSKSKSKVPKERKLLPCKDRVYDPDKHCGVFIQEIGKQCTRSLTCKTHSLAMRRNVAGRRKHFDELLAEHRAAKEALVKVTKAEAVTINSSSNSQISNCSESPGSGMIGATSTALSCVVSSGTATSVMQGSTKLNSNIIGGSVGLNTGSSSSSSQKPQLMSPAKSKSAVSRSNASGVVLPRPLHSLMAGSSSLDSTQKLSGDCSVLLANGSSSAGSKDDTGFIAHHPRPAAICTYNARQMGLGFFVCDRRLDSIRAALRTALGERFTQPLPVKKLCVESKLPPVPEPSDPSDPYCFLLNEPQASPVPAGILASAATPMTSSLTSVAAVSSSSTTTMTPTVVGSVTASSKSSQSKLGKTGRLSKSKQNKDNVASNSTSTNHVSRNSSTAGSVRSGPDDGGGRNVNLPPSNKRKRSSSSTANKCSSVNNVASAANLQKSSHSTISNVHSVSSQSNVPAGLLSVPFPLSAQLTPTLSHLGMSKNGSVTPVIPACSASVQGVRNHATLATANTHKDLNLVVTSMEVVNGQFGHGAGPVLARTSGTACIPVTTTGAMRGSLAGLGIGLAPHPLTAGGTISATLNPGPNRASISSSSPSLGMPSISQSSLSPALSSAAKDGKSLSAKRAKSSSSVKSSRTAHSITTLAPCTTKWNSVNNTTVLTGMGALSNANLLSGQLTANNHIAMSAISNNNLSPPGLASSANFRPSSVTTHLSSSSSSSPLPNGLGPSPPPMPVASLHHKNLTNHVLPDNTATFNVSPGVHKTITSPDHPLPNCDVFQHKGKGFRQNSSMKSSSNQKSTHQHHQSLPSIHSSSGLPLVASKTIGSLSQVLAGNNPGSVRLAPPASGAALLTAVPSVNKHSSSSQGSVGNMPTSLPLPSSSSIPIKLMTTTSASSTKSQNPKSFMLSMDELRRPAEMQGSPTLPS